MGRVDLDQAVTNKISGRLTEYCQTLSLRSSVLLSLHLILTGRLLDKWVWSANMIISPVTHIPPIQEIAAAYRLSVFCKEGAATHVAPLSKRWHSVLKSEPYFPPHRTRLVDVPPRTYPWILPLGCRGREHLKRWMWEAQGFHSILFQAQERNTLKTGLLSNC